MMRPDEFQESPDDDERAFAERDREESAEHDRRWAAGDPSVAPPEDEPEEEGIRVAGLEAILAAGEEIVNLAHAGVSPDHFLATVLGFHPDAVREAAKATAQEEFDVVPGLPPGADATGRLRKAGLSANQRKDVKAAIEETFISAMMIGAVLEIARLRAELGGRAGNEGEGEGE